MPARRDCKTVAPNSETSSLQAINYEGPCSRSQQQQMHIHPSKQHYWPSSTAKKSNIPSHFPINSHTAPFRHHPLQTQHSVAPAHLSNLPP